MIWILGAIIGALLLASGAFSGFAAGMSDAPTEGDSAGKRSCAVAVIGFVVLVASLVMIVRSVL